MDYLSMGCEKPQQQAVHLWTVVTAVVRWEALFSMCSTFDIVI